VLLLNFIFPAAIKIVLIIGGFYLAYEGIEKVIHYLFHSKKGKTEVKIEKQNNNPVTEKQKIKSAIITDFILSIEIVIIALSTVLDKSIYIQIGTVAIVSILATVGVYGIVALIVRMDDAGHGLIRISKNKGFLAMIGRSLVK